MRTPNRAVVVLLAAISLLASGCAATPETVEPASTGGVKGKNPSVAYTDPARAPLTVDSDCYDLRFHAESMSLEEVTAAIPEVTSEAQLIALTDACYINVGDALTEPAFRFEELSTPTTLTVDGSGGYGSLAGYEVLVSASDITFLEEEPVAAIELGTVGIGSRFQAQVTVENITPERNLSTGLFSYVTLASGYPLDSEVCTLKEATQGTTLCWLYDSTYAFSDELLPAVEQTFDLTDQVAPVIVAEDRAEAINQELAQPSALAVVGSIADLDFVGTCPNAPYRDNPQILIVAPGGLALDLC